MTIFGLTFGAPFILAGLLALPLIWFLLRLTPPRPRDEVFPPTAILTEIAPKEETPAQSPWWLTLLRLTMAALVILALSEPVWNARDKQLAAEGPVLIVLDNGWTAGAEWPERKAAARALLDEAADTGQAVALALTVTGQPEALGPQRASDIRPQLEAAQARSIAGDLSPITAALSQGATRFGTIAWLADGLQAENTADWLSAIKSHSAATVLYITPETGELQVLSGVANTPEALTVSVERADFNGVESGTVTAFDQKGRPLGTANFTFEGNTQFSQASFDLPVELRNEVARIAIDGAATAGSVQLLDERFRRRRVGIISGAKADAADQPLLAPTYYIDRALAPFSEVRQARNASVADAVPELLEQDVSTLVLADIGTLPTDTEDQLTDWVRRGGLLVRFAGPRMAGADSDALVPVDLRRGDRSLGGTLTWGTPQPLASFADDSPFAGLDVPADVTVSRQVLAEPGIDLIDRTWASLADGTPLITASQRDQGWIVLFH
ncbi:MAG: BatA domain-containing protein, partial [Pseudomonadota bacterium]